MKYLKKFQTTAQYNAYTADTENFILPNASLITETNGMAYHPYVPPPETRVVAKFNVTDTSNPIPIGYDTYTSGFSAIEIDGAAQPSVVSAYTFSTTGEHTVKYTLTDSTSIGMAAFYACYGITSITIPNSVTSIGRQAFAACSGLTSIVIPDSVTSIDRQAFNACYGITSITIPNGVTNIGNGTFNTCTGLTSVTIGTGVTSIGAYAFEECSSLTSITCNATTAPTIQMETFMEVNSGGTLYVPQGSTGYNTWMEILGDEYDWTKVEQ